jgi:hypothetical protein
VPPTPHHERKLRRARRATWLLASTALLSCLTAVNPAGAAEAKPSPSHLIVGDAISLPTSLFAANPPESSPSPLITTSQSNVVATAMWGLWERAMVTSDTRALAQLISPGPMLQGTLHNCAYPAGNCAPERQPRPLQSLTTVVPIQHDYPIYFLAEIETKELVSGTNGLNAWQPWVELQVLTKQSPSTSWKLSFDTGYNAPGGGAAALLPFDFSSAPNQSGSGDGSYNTRPSLSSTVPATEYLQQLGMYWQSFADTGHAPSSSAFASNGDTSGFGQSLEQFYPQGSLYVGHREFLSLSAPFAGASWVFAVSGGYPMVCGSVVATLTDMASTASDSLFQNSDESNYGLPLPGGEYSKIVSERAHDTCVYPVTGGLNAAGINYFDYATTGDKISNAPAAPKSSGLSDLETAYGVLGYQLTQYLKQLTACAHGNSSSCSTDFAKKAAQQFGSFSTQLPGYSFPSQVSAKVSSLESEAAGLSRLFTGLSKSSQTPQLQASGLANAVTEFQQHYSALKQILAQAS